MGREAQRGSLRCNELVARGTGWAAGSGQEVFGRALDAIRAENDGGLPQYEATSSDLGL